MSATAEDAPPHGELISVEFIGYRESRAGNRYRAFVVKKGDPTPESRQVLARAKVSMLESDDDLVPASPEDAVPF